jgi:beta-lactamase class A
MHGLTALLLMAALPQAMSAQPAGQGLQRLLEAEAARFPGKLGVWVKHLSTGEEAGVRADSVFNSASVIKIPVLILAYRMADAGQLSLPERVTIDASDMRGGSGIFRLHDPGLQPTLRDVLLQMIITSDNTATDIAIGKVGGVARVNAWLRERGIADGIRLNMTTGELFAKYNALPQGSNRNEKTNADSTYWLGSMTPRATGRLLEELQRCSDGGGTPPLAAQRSCADMLRMMRAQLAGSRRLPHFVGGVAHKTGDFPPVLANDVGIISARSGPIVVSVFTNSIQGPYGEAEDRIGRLAQLIVAYFDGAR